MWGGPGESERVGRPRGEGCPSWSWGRPGGQSQSLKAWCPLHHGQAWVARLGNPADDGLLGLGAMGVRPQAVLGGGTNTPCP